MSESSEGPVFRATAAAEHLPPSFPERAARGTVAKLRAWQEEALAEYHRRGARDFLVSVGGTKRPILIANIAALISARPAR